MRLKAILLTTFLLIAATRSFAAEETKTPQWIWGPKESSSKVWLRKSFVLDGKVKEAHLAAACDNEFVLFVNGQRTLGGDDWQKVQSADITKLLKSGENLLAVEAKNQDSMAGFVARLDVSEESGKKQLIVTDTTWRASPKAEGTWHTADYSDANWSASQELGAVGSDDLPWTRAINADSLATANGETSVTSATPEKTEAVTSLPDFKVEKIFNVPQSMGSWVSLAIDDKGRLIASDEGNAGLFLITPPNLADPASETRVQKMPVHLSGAQGLLCAFDSLYVMVNGGGESGLYRVSDSDGDGLFDKEELLMPIRGGGEHGPHAVISSPDKKSLFAIAGNHTKLPKNIAGSRIPKNWDEDMLLPRRWDAGNHAKGILAPGGWICQLDPSGKSWDVFSIGYRNQYDVAFNADGELFTYDSDMEWDFGVPWYRPTRICHVTDGSEFGWRSGTGNWPAYHDDSLPPALDLGPGSPVGLLFGYGAKFPAKYQKALFALDWTYSTIYAVHLTPDGASYRGEAEDFVVGQPMQVTDAVVGHDGAIYFTTGGRKTESALYRIVYVGDESTAPVDAKVAEGAELRALRRQLEEFHRPGDADMALIWKNLGSDDRFLRYAARIALEFRPVDSWKPKALTEPDARTGITALMALARQGSPDDLENVLKALDEIDFAKLSDYDQLAVTRVYGLAFIRLAKPSDEWRQKLVAKFEPLFPAASEQLNAELVQLLVYLQSPTIVQKSLAHMETLGPDTPPAWSRLTGRSQRYGGTVQAMIDNMPPVRAIHYALVLRTAKAGWTTELRRKYFEFFTGAAKHSGGSSYRGFLSQIRDEAYEGVPAADRIALEDIVSVPLGAKPFKAIPPAGPGRKWTREEALAALGPELNGRNFDRGRNLFHATSCAKCHHFAGEGGAIGPDLSTAGRKFSLADLMDAIIEPSKAISDQYGSHVVLTDQGQTFNGRVVDVGNELQIYLQDPNAKPVVVKKANVEEMKVSLVSQMPVGLVDSLNEEELKDLIAYILSSGNKKAPYYRP